MCSEKREPCQTTLSIRLGDIMSVTHQVKTPTLVTPDTEVRTYHEY